MIPKITIDREQAEWVEIAGIGKRIALYEDDASVVCVVGDQEELFKSGEPFRISPWSKKAYTFSFTFTGEKVFPVKPKMRLMTIEEIEEIAGEKVFPIKPKMRPSTIEEIALEVQMNCNDPKFCWRRTPVGHYTVYRPGISAKCDAEDYQKALRSSDKDETPLAELKWEEFMTEEKQ